MLKFVLRIFVVLAIGFVLSNEVVDRAANYLFESETANYTREAVRGQLHSLKQELAHVPPDARPDYVRNTLAPHYGLALQVLEPADYNAADFALTGDERRTIDAGGFFLRDNLMSFVAAIPGPGAQWLMVKLPPEPLVGTWVIVAIYAALGVLLCAFMLVWALPVWRDLEALKTAAQRMGQGDLRVRAQLSRFSSIRGLGDTFNQMSERISALISNQRELTNAVSHELRLAQSAAERHPPRRRAGAGRTCQPRATAVRADGGRRRAGRAARRSRARVRSLHPARRKPSARHWRYRAGPGDCAPRGAMAQRRGAGVREPAGRRPLRDSLARGLI